MTPEEAAEWAEQFTPNSNPMAVINDGASCICRDCKAPVYLDSMCAAHWRLLLGYPGHVRLREMREHFEDAKADPTVQMLEALWALS